MRGRVEGGGARAGQRDGAPYGDGRRADPDLLQGGAADHEHGVGGGARFDLEDGRAGEPAAGGRRVAVLGGGHAAQAHEVDDAVAREGPGEPLGRLLAHGAGGAREFWIQPVTWPVAGSRV